MNAQTMKKSFEIILISSKRKPNFTDKDRERKFITKISQNFLNNKTLIIILEKTR